MTGTSDARGRRALLVALSGIALVLIAAVAWVGIRGFLAKGELDSVVDITGLAVSSVADGDVPLGKELLGGATEHAATAASLTGDPVWRAVEIFPWIGPNLHAVRVAADQTHVLLRDTAAPVLAVAEAASTPDSDAILDLEALRSAAPSLRGASDAASDAQSELSSIDLGVLLSPLADGVGRLVEAADALAPVVAGVADAAEIMPTMLGVDETRSILVMVQNNAELRTGGGITGTFLELRADAGALVVNAQSDSSDFDKADSAVIDMPESTVELYGDAVGEWVQNTSMAADFDVTSRLASAWWEGQTGRTPDAVLSIDPIVLKALLGVQGPIDTEFGSLDADDLIDTLLVNPYLTMSQSDQTLMFEAVSRAAFGSLTSRDLDLTGLASALAEPISAGRVSLWSAHEDEERILAGTTLAGPSARQTQAGANAYAVYLNDSTGGKMDTLLDVEIGSGVARCAADETLVDSEIAVTLTSRAPADAASLPVSMTGGGHWGTPAGDIATIVTVSAPLGSFYGAVTIDGEKVAPTTLEDAGFPVSSEEVVLHPGESKTISFRFISESGALVDPVVLHTPLLADPELSAIVPTCD